MLIHLRQLLAAGISVAAINSRLIQLPAPFQDSARALQFLRSRAKEWNFDKTRVAAFGALQGAQISMYLAFHDEMADRESGDHISRESTRLSLVATRRGQTTWDVDWMNSNIPGFGQANGFTSADWERGFGTDDPKKLKAIVADIPAQSKISADDPPIFMEYRMSPSDPVPQGARARSWTAHHVSLGVRLNEQMDELGIEAHLTYPGKEATYKSIADFLIREFQTTAGLASDNQIP